MTISAKGSASFARHGEGCLLGQGCTTAKSGRSLRISEHDRLLAAARAQAETPEFAQTYRRRSSAERSLAWVVARGHRRCPYRGGGA